MPEAEENLLESLLEASVEWWKNAGVPEYEDNHLYDLGVYMLAASWYNVRGAVSATDLRPVPFGVYAIKHQLEIFPSG